MIQDIQVVRFLYFLFHSWSDSLTDLGSLKRHCINTFKTMLGTYRLSFNLVIPGVLWGIFTKKNLLFWGALEHRYMTLRPKQVISELNDPKLSNFILKIIKVAPQTFHRFMFCIPEIFFENFERFSLRCSNFVNFLARKMLFL